MKTTIIPRTIVHKPTKAGVPKWEVEDSERYIYSVWDLEIYQKLCGHIMTPCDVDVDNSKDGKWKTIRAFYGAGPGAQARIDEQAGGFKKVCAEPEPVRDGLSEPIMAKPEKVTKLPSQGICGTYKLTIEKLQ